MPKIARFVIWICSKFTRKEIELIINGLIDVLHNRNPEIKPKDDFKQKHPQYRSFSIDPHPPLTEMPDAKPKKPSTHYKLILTEYEALHGKPLRPVKRRASSPQVPATTICPHCSAPHSYLYYNDGRQRSQVRCKVCGHLFLISMRSREKKLNTTAPIVSMPCLSGKSARRSLSINVVLVAVRTASRTLINLIPLNGSCVTASLLNLSCAISIGSTTSSPGNSSTLLP